MSNTEEFRQSIAITIAKARDGQEAGKIADQILRRDKQGNQLVGVDATGQRAAYYEPKMYQLTSYPLGPEYLDGKWARAEARPESEGEVQAWIDEIGRDSFAWMYPRWW